MIGCYRAGLEELLEGNILLGFRRRRAGEQGRSLPPPAPQASLSLFLPTSCS